MKYVFCIISILIVPYTITSMNHDNPQIFKGKKHYSPHLWANPKDVVHGIYLAEVINVSRAPIRISEIDFTLVETPNELKAEIEDYNNITPRLVTSVENYKNNKTILRHQFTQDTELTCIKVEHLLYPKIFKIVSFVRTHENNKCTIEVLNDDAEIIDKAQFINYKRLPKIVTRARITLNDENLNDIEVTTNTFSCR